MTASSTPTMTAILTAKEMTFEGRRDFALLFVQHLEEQHTIVRRVESLFKLADSIEKRVKGRRKRTRKLIQDIPTKAFRGEIVATGAELACREGREFESAVELLARIKRERDMLTPKRNGIRVGRRKVSGRS